MINSLRLADPRRDESVEWMLGVRSRVTATPTGGGQPPVPASADDDRCYAFLVVTGGDASNAEVWIADYDSEWTLVPTSLPALLDTILSDTDSWGAPQFTPMKG